MEKINLSKSECKRIQYYDFARHFIDDKNVHDLIKSDYLSECIKRDLINCLRNNDESVLHEKIDLYKYVEKYQKRQLFCITIIDACLTFLGKKCLEQINEHKYKMFKRLVDTYITKLREPSTEDIKQYIDNFYYERELFIDDNNLEITKSSERFISVPKLLINKTYNILTETSFELIMNQILEYMNHEDVNLVIRDHSDKVIDELSNNLFDIKFNLHHKYGKNLPKANVFTSCDTEIDNLKYKLQNSIQNNQIKAKSDILYEKYSSESDDNNSIITIIPSDENVTAENERLSDETCDIEEEVRLLFTHLPFTFVNNNDI